MRRAGVLAADALEAGHHGSRTSSSEPLLDEVSQRTSYVLDGAPGLDGPGGDQRSVGLEGVDVWHEDAGLVGPAESVVVAHAVVGALEGVHRERALAAIHPGDIHRAGRDQLTRGVVVRDGPMVEEEQPVWSSEDLGFRGDESRVREGHGAENLSTLRRIALNLLKQDTSKKVGIETSDSPQDRTKAVCFICSAFAFDAIALAADSSFGGHPCASSSAPGCGSDSGRESQALEHVSPGRTSDAVRP